VPALNAGINRGIENGIICTPFGLRAWPLKLGQPRRDGLQVLLHLLQGLLDGVELAVQLPELVGDLGRLGVVCVLDGHVSVSDGDTHPLHAAQGHRSPQGQLRVIRQVDVAIVVQIGDGQAHRVEAHQQLGELGVRDAIRWGRIAGHGQGHGPPVVALADARRMAT